MARTFYSVVFCLALAMLATMWLKPGVAQDLIDMARRVRMQSPDPIAGAPQYSLPPNLPGSNMPGAPVQPMPATRPVGWPGTPASSYNPPPPQYRAQSGPANNAVPGAGVTVWDPTGNRMVAAPANPNGPANPSGPQNPTVQGNSGARPTQRHRIRRRHILPLNIPRHRPAVIQRIIPDKLTQIRPRPNR